MRPELKEIQLIEHYLEGKLSAAQSEAFVQKMNTDAAFGQRVDLQQKLVARIEHLALVDSIQLAHANFAGGGKTGNWKWGLGGAMLILALLSSAFLFIPKGKTIQPAIQGSTVPIVDSIPEPSDSLLETPTEIVESEKKPPRKSGQQLMKGFQVPFNAYTFDAAKGLSVKDQRSGSSIEVPAHAFVDKNGNPVKGQATLKYREFRDPADMAFAGIPMHFHPGKDTLRFNSAGMFEIRAHQNGRELNLAGGKAIGLDFQTTEKLDKLSFYELNDQNKKWTKIEELRSEGEDIVNISERSEKASIKVLQDAPFNSYVQLSRAPQQQNWNSFRQLVKKNLNRELTEELTGKVMLRVFVNTEGRITKMVTIKSAHPALTRAVKRSIGILRFSPGMQNNKKIPVWVNVPVSFVGVSGNGSYKGPKTQVADTPGWEIEEVSLDSVQNQETNFVEPTLLGDMITTENDSLLSLGKNQAPLTINNKLKVGLTLNGMGVFNCDQLRRVKNRVRVNPEFVSEDGQKIEAVLSYTIIDHNLNAAFYYGLGYGTNWFEYDKMSKNSMFLISRYGDLFLLKAGNFQHISLPGGGGKTRVKLEKVTGKFENVRDLRLYLGLG